MCGQGLKIKKEECRMKIWIILLCLTVSSCNCFPRETEEYRLQLIASVKKFDENKHYDILSCKDVVTKIPSKSNIAGGFFLIAGAISGSSTGEYEIVTISCFYKDDDNTYRQITINIKDFNFVIEDSLINPYITFRNVPINITDWLREYVIDMGSIVIDEFGNKHTKGSPLFHLSEENLNYIKQINL